jgi:hypothetical protein
MPTVRLTTIRSFGANSFLLKESRVIFLFAARWDSEVNLKEWQGGLIVGMTVYH